jgi:hypothetical protein
MSWLLKTLNSSNAKLKQLKASNNKKVKLIKKFVCILVSKKLSSSSKCNKKASIIIEAFGNYLIALF